MSPAGVVAAARERGLGLIAITDHNTAENVAAALRAAAGRGGPKVLPGMELCTAEEVHLLALFADVEAVLAFQEIVYRALPPKTNRPELFGDQVVANEWDEVEGFSDRFLIGATSLDLPSASRAIHDLGGLVIASHVDKEAFSLLGQLGFIPPGLALEAVEVTPGRDLMAFLAAHPDLAGRAVIKNSDAHQLDQVGQGFTEFLMAEPSFSELALALAGREGRRIVGVS
jgi:predicted metal-dependent phosphoesterase TrpH